MEELLNVASYISKKYSAEYGTRIDEMKLHKLLYFSQRESLIQSNEPLFAEVFYGWKYGPILKEIRAAYRDNLFYETIPQDVEKRILPVMDKVFEKYAGKDSLSLRRLTLGELAWKNSRKGIPDCDNSDNPMALDDIKLDADRISYRRRIRQSLGLS